MKIGILTFHASHNYGSMLQAYAIQKELQLLGHDSLIINLRTKIQKGLIPPQISLAHPRNSICKLIKTPGVTLALQRKYSRFEQFLSYDLICSRELANQEAVGMFIQENHFDAVIVGSDQIWNVGCWDFDKSYLLDFDFPIYRIAYAPSLGLNPETFTKEDREMLAKSWAKFNCLSTREQRGAEIIKQACGRDADIVLDPTLLLCGSDYEPLLSEKPVIKEKYIFYYSPIDKPEIFGKAKSLADKTGLKIVVTQKQPYYKGDYLIHVWDCGPRQFLNLLKNAEFTIGKSFHLLAFSLLFHKDFYSITADEDSRLQNLMEPLGLMDRAVPLDLDEIQVLPNIDYSKVDSKLKKMKESSIDYLVDALKLKA